MLLRALHTHMKDVLLMVDLFDDGLLAGRQRYMHW